MVLLSCNLIPYYGAALICIFRVDFIQAQTWNLGDVAGPEICYSNRDCPIPGSRCIQQKCACRSTHFLYRGECIAKIRPGQSPCKYDAQCEAIWPGTQCVNTICQCRDGVHVKTRDGIVCVQRQSCPTGGEAAVLRDADGRPATCHISAAGFMSGCLEQLHTYDCIRDKYDRGNFYCCPNKAMTCSQPENDGFFPQYNNRILPMTRDNRSQQRGNNNNNNNVRRTQSWPSSATNGRQLPWYLRQDGINTSPSSATASNNAVNRSAEPTAPLQPGDPRAPLTRWLYDPRSASCQPFAYRGAGGNANNFMTLQHCENFCKTSCGRGSPLFQKGPDGRVHQYMQRQQMCNPKTGCGEPQFHCAVLQPGKALCCPKKEFICSNYGGSVQRVLPTPFDDGIFCGQDRVTTFTRFYYDASARRCRSFPYKGCSGNFNNFLTLAECQELCEGSNNFLFGASNNMTSDAGSRQLEEDNIAIPFQYIWANRTRRPDYFG